MAFEKKYNLKKFKTPIEKPIQELEKDDVVTFEFADYDNWVIATIKSYKELPEKETEHSKVLEIIFEDLYGNQKTCYGFIYSKYDYLMKVIGKTESLEKSQILDFGNQT